MLIKSLRPEFLMSDCSKSPFIKSLLVEDILVTTVISSCNVQFCASDKITTLYKVIADHQYNAESYQKIADKGTKYDSLQAAYDAYVEKITEDSNYSQFKDTLSKN